MERSAGMLRSGLPHEGLPLKQQQRRQARLDRLAAGTLGGWLLFALPLGTAGWLRAPRPRPLGLVPLAVTAAGAGVLLALRDPSLLPALVGFFAGAAAIHLLSAGAHLRLVDRPWLQRGLAVGALLATVALGGLTLGQWRPEWPKIRHCQGIERATGEDHSPHRSPLAHRPLEISSS